LVVIVIPSLYHIQTKLATTPATIRQYELLALAFAEAGVSIIGRILLTARPFTGVAQD
jgi:hypothetical protein